MSTFTIVARASCKAVCVAVFSPYRMPPGCARVGVAPPPPRTPSPEARVSDCTRHGARVTDPVCERERGDDVNV